MLAALAKLTAPLRTRIANMVARAIIRTVNDGTKMQVVQLSVLDGETREAIERFQNYGFTSVPLDGAEAVALFVDGKRDHGFVIVADDRRYRMKGLQPGEVAMYHKDGASIVLKADGSIALTPKAGADIVLAGGTAGVSRIGDSTAGHTHAFTLVAPSGGGAVTGTIAPATDSMQGGAPHVKA